MRSKLNRCRHCKFYEPPFLHAGQGTCYRYPEPVVRFDHSWCGEFKAKECYQERLLTALINVVNAEQEDTGAEPSVSVYHRALDEASKLLKEIHNG